MVRRRRLLDDRGRRLVPDPVSGLSWFRAALALAPDGSWLVGHGAVELRATHPDRYRDDLKRHLDVGAPVYLAGTAHPVPELLGVLIGPGPPAGRAVDDRSGHGRRKTRRRGL